MRCIDNSEWSVSWGTWIHTSHTIWRNFSKNLKMSVETRSEDHFTGVQQRSAICTSLLLNTSVFVVTVAFQKNAWTKFDLLKLTFWIADAEYKRQKRKKKNEIDCGRSEKLHSHIIFSRNIANYTTLLLAPAANMLGTSRLPIGCLIWQHADVLEAVCATNSIVTFLPAERTGLFTPLLTCSALLLFSHLYFGENSLSPIFFLLFTPLDKLFWIQSLSSLCFSGTKYSKSNCTSYKTLWDSNTFCLSCKFISNLHIFCKTIPFLVLVGNFPFELIAPQIYKKRVPKFARISPNSITVSVR